MLYSRGNLLLIFTVLIFLLPISTIAKRHRKNVLAECHVDMSNATFTLLMDCVRDKSLLYLDRITATDSIDLLAGGALKLVRRQNETSEADHDHHHHQDNPQDLSSHSPWAVSVVNKLTHLLRTHVLQIEVISPVNKTTATAEGRARRRQQMMLPAMMFGIIAIGMILVPIGFQFLSMFAGKAVLLAKLALMLASLNGLKRLANTGLNYGFYTSHEGQHHHMPPPPLPLAAYPRPIWDRGDQPRGFY